MPDYVDIVINETPIYIDVTPSQSVYIDINLGGQSVTSVNGQTGVVVLDAGDVGADASGSAASALVAANGYTDTEVATKLDIPTGTPDGTKYLRDDNSWQPVTGGTDSIALFHGTTSFNPADSSTYYWGQGFISAHPAYTSLVLGKADAIDIPKTGAIKAIHLKVNVWTTVGSTENSTFKINILDSTGAIVSTNTISSTIKFNVNPAVLWLPYDFTGLNIAVTRGGYILLQLDTPAWVTNPTNVYFQGHILIE